MSDNKNVILTKKEISHKLRRIAYQIYETNVDEDAIILAGIEKNGYIMARRLKSILTKISGKQIVLCKVIINKKRPLNNVETSLDAADYKNKSVVLVDDVLNSGTTLIYGVRHFLDVPLKRFKTAVLVNRNHKKYPVKADFKGLSLSTSIREHIQVEMEGENACAVLV